MVVFLQKVLYLGKSGGIRANYCVPTTVVFIGQKLLYSGKSCSSWARWLY